MKNQTLLPWGPREKEKWFNEQSIKRSYQNEVVFKIKKLSEFFELIEYGKLSISPEKYPLFILRTKNYSYSKPSILITGGVHGYETSGVHGALLFMEKHVERYLKDFNFFCAPCISPWAYETINRWNNLALDPNRSFYQNSPVEECRLFLEEMKRLNVNFLAHFDLHETTDTDNSVFRPALEQRDGITQEESEIPDGFYVVGNSHRTEPEFQRAVIAAVKKVTHIAPTDPKGMLIGVKVEDEGVVNYDMKKLSLCGGFSDAKYATTTEVYPDSPRVNETICNEAQVAAVCGGLDFIKSRIK